MPKQATIKAAFTLLELMLVLAIMAMVTGLAVPLFSKSFTDMRIKSSVRTIARMGKYARTMAILRQETMMVAINTATREVYLGAKPENTSTNATDGQIDQDVLKRLGYVEGEKDDPTASKIDKEQHRFLPEQITIVDVEMDDAIEQEHDDLYIINYYANGQSDWFKIEIEDASGIKALVESDPISGKITTEYE